MRNNFAEQLNALRIENDLSRSQLAEKLNVSVRLISYWENLCSKYPICSIEDGLSENDWEGFIDSFLEPVDIGREYAEKYGMKIFFGCEIRFSENDNDYLVYGITAEYLKKNPDILEWGIGKFFEESKTEGFLVYQAHPFRDGMTVTRTKYLHGIEVNNGHPGQNSRNDIARLWADIHGLSMISGSDFHEVGHEARGGIITFRDINDEKELCEILKKGEYRLICDYNGGFLR